MMGGNPRNGWCFKTRNPGFCDTVRMKQDMFADPVTRYLEMILERAIEQLTQALNNQSQKPEHIGEKGVDNDFRDSYV